MNILFTGASGFLGENILPYLQHHNITTLGIESNNAICVNLANETPNFNAEFDMVLHAAGKAHSNPRNEAEAQLFHDVNYTGTVNLCKSLEKTSLPNSFVFISTVAVYGIDYGENITENHELNPNTPYGISKLNAEIFLKEWAAKNNVNLTILRPSLIAGVNPVGNLGAMVSGIKTGRYLNIGGGSAKKSVLMAKDIAILLDKLYGVNGTYNVCSTYSPTFYDLETIICKQLNKKHPISIPSWIAHFLAKIGDLMGTKAPINSSKLQKITKSLTFSNEKIVNKLEWEPLDVIENFKIK